MDEQLDFDFAPSFDTFEDADAYLSALEGIIIESQQLFNENGLVRPYDRLVQLLKQGTDSQSAFTSNKRQKLDSVDVLTGPTSSSSDEEWLDAICAVMENSDFAGSLVQDILEQRKRRGSKPRKEYVSQGRAKDLSYSVWGRMLQHPELANAGSWVSRKFRRRFRVPYSMFLEIVEECKEHNVFGIPVRKSKILIEYKVLSCLKILGRDLCCDEIDEALNIAESTVNKFFKQFVYNFANALFDKYVHVPEGAELDAVQEVYSIIGKFLTSSV